MLQHKIRYLDVLEPKKPASDGCFSNEIYLYLVRPEGMEKTCSLRTAVVTWLRSPAAVRGYMIRDVPVYVHPHLRHHWLCFIQYVMGVHCLSMRSSHQCQLRIRIITIWKYSSNTYTDSAPFRKFNIQILKIKIFNIFSSTTFTKKNCIQWSKMKFKRKISL